MIETVVVDFDDTLIASSRAARRARRHLRSYGIDPRRFALVTRRWWGRVSAGEVTIEQMRHGRIAEMGLEGEVARAAEADFRRIAEEVSLRTGARRLVGELRASGKRVVILTNFQGEVHRQHAKLARVGIPAEVDGVVVTGEIGVHKPDPRAFAAALEVVGGRAAHAAMLGDNVVNDIAGALDAGFARAVWITRRRRVPIEDRRLVVVRNLEQARTALLA